METKVVENLNAVIMRVKKENYLLEVKDVKEIYIPGDRIIPVPLAENYIVGIIEIRDIIYTVISLRYKINPNENDYGLSEVSRILLLNIEGYNIGLLVDSVVGVKEFPGAIFNTDNIIIETDMDWRHINSVGIVDDKSYILLNLQSLISLPKRRKMEHPLQDQLAGLVPQGGRSQQPADLRFEEPSPRTIRPKMPNYKRTISRVDESLIITPTQKDALMEIGNIGTGNAVTALSKLIKQRVDIDFTEVKIVNFEKISKEFEVSNEKVCGIFSHIEKPSQSTLLQIFEMTPLIKIAANLAGDKTKVDPLKVKSKNDLDDFAISTVVEVGNIMAGHYASALANLMGIKLIPDVPDFTMTEVGSLGEFLGKELQKISKYIIMIKTKIQIVDAKVAGFFLFIPDLDSLELLFDKLGIDYEGNLLPIEVPSDENIFNIKKVKLTDRQKDALKEVGNIGAGNAANALAKMLNTRVDINIPSVQIVELEKYADRLGSKKEKLFVSWSNVLGLTRATVLTIFRVPDIVNLMTIITASKEKIDLRKIKEFSDFPELFGSAMSEVGHILASHYTSAIGNLLGIKLMTEPPDVNIDTGTHLFQILKDEIDVFEDLSLIITTNVIIKEQEIEGTFLFIPDLSTLKDLLDALEDFY